MKTYKPCLGIFFIVALMLVSLTGCSGEKDGSSFSYSDGIDENGFWKDITALDYVELYDYSNFTIPSETHTISDEDVQNEIDSLLADYSTSESITDRKVEDGDTVNIDYVGSVDGVEFDGGSTGGEGTEVIIGETSYIDDFIEQLIGHEPGETFDINVTFPEDYGQDELNGKDAVFVTTINHIVKTVNPELTDAFVVENLSAEHGWNTISEMRDGISVDLQKTAIQNYIQEYLSSDVTVKSVPDSLIEYQVNAMKKYYQDSAESSGMELDEFLSSYAGVSTLDELVTSSSDENTKSAEYSLVIQAIAEDVKITVTEEDVANYFKDENGTDDYSEYEENYGMPYLKQAVISSKVMNYLLDHTVLE
jgi:trigger factor